MTERRTYGCPTGNRRIMTPPPGARRYWAAVAAAALSFIAACGTVPRDAWRPADTSHPPQAAVWKDRPTEIPPADSVTFERLAFRLLTVPPEDKESAYRLLVCDARRLVYTYQPMRAAAFIRSAHLRVERRFPKEARQRDSVLGGRVYFYPDSLCARLAHAGLLGDTAFPVAPSAE